MDSAFRTSGRSKRMTATPASFSSARTAAARGENRSPTRLPRIPCPDRHRRLLRELLPAGNVRVELDLDAVAILDVEAVRHAVIAGSDDVGACGGELAERRA